MKTEGASMEATTNPQAYACLGVTLFAGFLGVFFGVFLADLTLRVAVAGACFVVFVAGIGGHSYFKKQEAASSFRPSRAVRRALGFGFGLSILGALGFAIFAVVSLNIGYAVLPVAYAMIAKNQQASIRPSLPWKCCHPCCHPIPKFGIIRDNYRLVANPVNPLPASN